MNKRPLSLLSLSLLFSLPSALIGCGGDDPPADPGAGGTAGTAGVGGAAGSGAGTAGSSAGTAGSGAGTAGSGAGTAGSAGSGAGTAGSAGSAGSAGAGGSGGSTGGGAVPTDTSSAGLEAFLGAMSYQGAGWVPESAAPREGEASSPHGRVRVFFNQTMLDSIAADNGPLGNRMPHTEGSMVVKEMYDAGTTVVGRAALLRSGGAYVYHCASSVAGTCYSASVANEITHGASNCACHTNGVIITPPPM